MVSLRNGLCFLHQMRERERAGAALGGALLVLILALAGALPSSFTTFVPSQRPLEIPC